MTGLAQTAKDSTRVARSLTIDEVVVTGTRNETDVRHLPMTISVVNRKVLEQSFQPSVLPVLTEQVPGLFTTSRGIMGYGVSTGAAGGMSLRGIGGSPTAGLLVLIDGHPQYMGLMGHPIADAYQTMLTDRVEVLRGPASVLYGSNAMGGVINIVTRKMQEDAVRKGFVKVTWPGRFQVLEKEPTVIADGAHNRDAARRLAENVRTYLTDRKIVGVMGVFKDKEYEQIAEIMAPYLSKVYTIDLPNGERNLGKERLCEVLKELFADDLRESREQGIIEGRIEGRNAGRIEGRIEGRCDITCNSYSCA